MEFWLEIDGETVDFDVTRDRDEIRVTRSGVTRIAAVECSGATYRVTVDGRTFELTREGDEPRGLPGEHMLLERSGAGYDVSWAARRSSRASASADETASDGAVFPLMPGTIMEVNVAVGDAVAEGGVLLVLEAMKMQNEVQSPVAGTVAEVNVGPGANVDRRTMMIRIEPGAPGGS